MSERGYRYGFNKRSDAKNGLKKMLEEQKGNLEPVAGKLEGLTV